MKNLRLGDRLEWLINLITFGQGNKIATFIAVKIFKKEDCGCSRKKNYLNNLFLPEQEKTITLK